MIRRLRTSCAVTAIALVMVGCGRADAPAPLEELQRTKSGDLDIVLLSSADGLTHGKDSFVLEFRSQSDGTLRDAGTVRANATMPMAGMPPMFGTLELRASETPGRYLVNSDLSMAGTWQINLEWQGPTGTGATTIRGAVR